MNKKNSFVFRMAFSTNFQFGLFHQNGNGEAVFRGNLLEQNLDPLLDDRLDGIPVAVILDDDLIDDFIVQRQRFPG